MGGLRCGPWICLMFRAFFHQEGGGDRWDAYYNSLIHKVRAVPKILRRPVPGIAVPLR